MNDTWELTPEKFLNTHELSQLLRRAQEIYDLGMARKRKGLIRDWFLIHTALFTGLRRAEICQLMVSDLHIGNGQSHIVVRTRKGGECHHQVGGDRQNG